MEITQYTYFQQAGGFEVKPVAAELTYGLERIAMYLQNVENVFDVAWARGVKYREVFHRNEVEMSEYSMRASDPKMLFGLFATYEAECQRLLQAGLPLPAYDFCLKCSHTFNNLDARGAISVTERAAYIGRVRALAHLCAKGYLESREALGFPMLPPGARAAAVEAARAARAAAAAGT
jgi:glycyl-tRNA synthetase alpha chain